MKEEMGPVALVEPHDSHIRQIVVTPGLSVTLDFDRLNVYHCIRPEVHQVWSYRATLTLTGVARFFLQSLLESNDYVDDAVVFTGLDEAPWIELLTLQQASRVSVTFGNGATLSVDCVTAHLTLQTDAKYLEDFCGPL